MEHKVSILLINNFSFISDVEGDVRVSGTIYNRDGAKAYLEFRERIRVHTYALPQINIIDI